MSQDRANDIAESESDYGMNIAASDDIAMNRYVICLENSYIFIFTKYVFINLTLHPYQ